MRERWRGRRWLPGATRAALGALLCAVLLLSGVPTALAASGHFSGGSGAVPGVQPRELWVDPLHGDDAADGGARATALLSLGMALRRIPHNVALPDGGYHIWLVAGTYPKDLLPNYVESL